MSLYGMQKFLFESKRDNALRQSFKTDPEHALDAFPLTDEEKQALKTGDLAALYCLGCHPLLLAPYSRFMGIPRPRYQKVMAPLKGVRAMKS